MKTQPRVHVLATILCTAMIIFTTANASAVISADVWQEITNRLGYYDKIPTGEVAILNNCGFSNGTDYLVLFGAVHGVRVTGPNMPHFKGNNFVIVLGDGENGYTGEWGSEIFTDPRPGTFFVVIVGKTESIRPIWFMTWYKISGEEFEKYCGSHVPFKGRDIEKTWALDGNGPMMKK